MKKDKPITNRERMLMKRAFLAGKKHKVVPHTMVKGGFCIRWNHANFKHFLNEEKYIHNKPE